MSLVAALLLVGDISAAREQLERATTALTDLGGSADLGEARRLATVAGVRDRGPLTPRGLELRLVSEGMSNPEIALQLVVSEHTVHRHVANILAKLGQSSRTGAAAAYAINTGLL